LPICKRLSFSRNATPNGQALNVCFQQELTLNPWLRNDGFVPTNVACGSSLAGLHTLGQFQHGLLRFLLSDSSDGALKPLDIADSAIGSFGGIRVFICYEELCRKAHPIAGQRRCSKISQ
jgi:hypothetical protein